MAEQAKPECTVADCRKPQRCRGLCRTHYDRWLKYDDPMHTPGPGGPTSTPRALTRYGLSKKQRDYWIMRGWLKVPLDPRTGRRAWTATEIRVALVMARLTGAGLDLATAARVARSTVVRGRPQHRLAGGLVLTVTEPASDRDVDPF